MASRVLVTGSRDWSDYAAIRDALKHVGALQVIEGGARGADALAARAAAELGIGCIEMPADWNTYGKRAGSIRNQQMLDNGKPDLVLAFPLPSSRGTWDMVTRARRAGVPVEVYEAHAPEERSDGK